MNRKLDIAKDYEEERSQLSHRKRNFEDLDLQALDGINHDQASKESNDTKETNLLFVC